jgi:hypothetical protein
MENLAINPSAAKAVQEFGTVVAQQGSCFDVETPSGLFRLKRAFSCVVAPEVGDRVLVVRSPLEGGFILSVLKREPGAKATLAFEADVDIITRKGKLGMVSPQGVAVASHKEIHLLASKIGMSAAEGDIRIGKLSVLGEACDISLKTVKFLARTCESVLERFMGRAKRSYRIIEDMDQVKAGTIHHTAEKALMLRGTFAQMTAKDDVHIDAERIHVG